MVAHKFAQKKTSPPITTCMFHKYKVNQHNQDIVLKAVNIGSYSQQDTYQSSTRSDEHVLWI